MPTPTIDATTGGRAANSYETVAEANAYYDSRATIAPELGDADPTIEALLIMATRTLEANMRGAKRLVPETTVPHYVIGRAWNGSPATATQRLPWPRVGLQDANGNPLDLAITGATVANPCVLTFAAPHRRAAGDRILVFGATGYTPDINGERTVTLVDDYRLGIGITTTGVPAQFPAGSVAWIPQELKDALAELAGQLVKADRTLDNDVIVQGLTELKAGSVMLRFRDSFMPQPLPDAVVNLLVPSWYAEESYENANAAEFGIVSASPSCGGY